MRLAGAKSEELPSDRDIAVTFYGDLFREEVTKEFEAPFQLVELSRLSRRRFILSQAASLAGSSRLA